MEGTGEMHGVADGRPLRLANGLTVEKRIVGGQRVSNMEVLDALRGLAELPGRDLDLLARAGVPIRLLPTASLEATPTGAPLLGATTVVGGTHTPPQVTMVRVAVRAGRSGRESTSEILQHEVGHAVSVLTTGDEGEGAAERYAARH